jgi:hypothetical protein
MTPRIGPPIPQPIGAAVDGVVSRSAHRQTSTRLRTAFLGMPSALPRGRATLDVPGAFNEAARSERPTQPWQYVRRPMLACAIAARGFGLDVRRETKRRIREFLDALWAEVEAILPDEEDLDVIRAAIDETHAEGVANDAQHELVIATAQGRATAGLVSRAREGFAHHMDRLRRLTAAADRQLVALEATPRKPALTVHR